MKRFQNYLLLTSRLAVVSLALALSNVANVVAESTKSVEIVGTPNVNVVNTPNVNVGNTPNVMVRNPADNPVLVRTVDESANEPFQAILCHQSGDLLNPRCPESIINRFTVPTTTDSGASIRRLVIEHVSGVCIGPALAGPPELNASLSQAPPGGFIRSFNFFVPVLSIAASPTTLNYQSFAQPARIYADPGTDVTASANSFGGLYTVCQFQVNGHFVKQ